MKPNETKLRVELSEDDFIACECGSEVFVQTVNVIKAISPIIGQRPQHIPKAFKFQCWICKKFVTDDLKSRKERRNESNSESKTIIT